MPAVDVLNLESNEGLGYKDDISLLFAASGDLRNVVKTVTSVPEPFGPRISVVINDQDFGVISRNAILLLVGLVAESAEQAIDCMVHVWYSAAISEQHMSFLNGPVRKLVLDVCSKITSKPAGLVLGKTWHSESRSLRLVLLKEEWFALLKVFSIPDGLTIDKAHEIRRAVTLAPSRVDFRDQYLYAYRPAHRVCMMKFLEDGILLPFGQSSALFDQPNPTLFQSANWTLNESADPVDGWLRADLSGYAYGSAVNDIYGGLYRYLNVLFSDFFRRLRSLDIHFELPNVDPVKLSHHLWDDTFTRIEVSNISDNYRLGAEGIASCLSRLLQ